MLLIGNGRLITGMRRIIFENGCVAIDGQVVKQVGTTEDLNKLIQKRHLLMLKVE